MTSGFTRGSSTLLRAQLGYTLKSNQPPFGMWPTGHVASGHVPPRPPTVVEQEEVDIRHLQRVEHELVCTREERRRVLSQCGVSSPILTERLRHVESARLDVELGRDVQL